MARPENFDRLSRKWQDYISSLELRLERREAELDQQRGVADKGTLIRIVGMAGEPDRPLPEYTTIRFKTGKGYEDFIDVHMGRTLSGGLLPYVTVRAGYEMLVNPSASNSAHIYAGNPYLVGAAKLAEMKKG